MEVNASNVMADEGLYDMLELFFEVAELCFLSMEISSERLGLHRRRRKPFWDVTSCLRDEEFRLCFRMRRSVFKSLVDSVRHSLTRNEKMGALRNGAIEPEVRVAVVVRILAGASYLDMMLIWQIGRSTIFQVFESTTSALLTTLNFDGFPYSERECSILSQQFSTSRSNVNPLHGCVGALDGVAVRIRKPRFLDCADPATYYHRKGYYAIPVQAICDARYRFTFFSAKCAGPTHDSVAFSVSSYYEELKSGKLPQNYWIMADEAYICDEHVLTPIPSSNANPGSAEDAFNFYHSSLRMHIEQSFGILMARWCILWKPLQFTLALNIRIIRLAMLLHNYCIEAEDEGTEGLLSENEYNEILSFTRSLMEDRTRPNRQTASLPGRSRSAMRSQRRRHLVQVIDELGYRRPGKG